jgi:HlyD family secretion protein
MQRPPCNRKDLLARHRLTAPYDALVVAPPCRNGSRGRAGDPIFTLIDPATVWIQAYVDEERAGQLALGQPGTIRLRSQPAASSTAPSPASGWKATG